MKDNITLISIIMSVYNEEPLWLREAIASILNQTYKNLEFIIIIDNPLNQTLIDIVEVFSKKDKRIKYRINSKNKGLIDSLNSALQMTQGKYIARMDADDISDKERLEKQLAYLKKHNLDLIGSNVRLFSGDREVFFITNKLLTHKYLKKMLAYGMMGMVHPTFFGTKEIFDVLQGYKKAYHAEDQDFLARAFCQGFKVGNIKEVLLDCRYSNESVTKTNAIYVSKISAYVTKVFQQCLKSNHYAYDASYYLHLKISQKEKDAFSKKKILMDEARNVWNEKRYFRFIVTLLRAMFTSKSTWVNIKMNLKFKYLKWREERYFGQAK